MMQKELLKTTSIKLDGAIRWALRDLNLGHDEIKQIIESKYSEEMISDNMEAVLLSQSLEMTSAQEPDWRIAAARFLVMDLYKKAAKHRKYTSFGYSGDYLSFLKDACSKGLYDSKIFDFYSEEELLKASMFLNPSYDTEFDFAGMSMMINRYLIKDGKEEYELPQEAFLTISLWLASREKTDRLGYVKKIYEALATRKISLATPILLNLRRNGNLSSCFIVAMGDSLENIMYTVKNVGMISKNGGGVGVNLSRVRALGATIKKTPGASGGVVPWIKIINDTAVAVNQLGKRAGAVTVALDVWHRDIFDFLELQTENGDSRLKAFDIFPQIVIPDIFMERVEEDGEWSTFDPHEVKSLYGVELADLWGEEFREIYLKLEKDENIKLRKTVKAKSIIKEVMKVTIETGMPYMFFKDAVNRMNPNKHDGLIGSGNLCQESFSNFRPSKISEPKLNELNGRIIQESEDGLAHTCNLASLNLSTLTDLKDIEEIARLAVRVLDDAIDLTVTPLSESKMHNNRYRTIGVGAMGLADYLAYHELKYAESVEEVDKLFERIAYYTIDESCNLAVERGKYPLFEGSDWSKGILLSKDETWFKENSKIYPQWMHLINKIKVHGVRNSQIMAIAPNTSSSLLQGCTASVLPVYSKFYIDKNSRGAMPICPPFLKSRFWYYTEYKNMDMKDVVNVISTIQKWTDQGISFEMLFNLNSGITARHMYETIMSAWKKKCKTIYYIRTVQKDGTSIEKNECVSCAN